MGCGRGLSEVDDTATAAAAATFPAAMATFTPRAASFHNTQHPRLDLENLFFFSLLFHRFYYWMVQLKRDRKGGKEEGMTRSNGCQAQTAAVRT